MIPSHRWWYPLTDDDTHSPMMIPTHGWWYPLTDNDIHSPMMIPTHRWWYPLTDDRLTDDDIHSPMMIPTMIPTPFPKLKVCFICIALSSSTGVSWPSSTFKGFFLILGDLAGVTPLAGRLWESSAPVSVCTPSSEGDTSPDVVSGSLLVGDIERLSTSEAILTPQEALDVKGHCLSRVTSARRT